MSSALSMSDAEGSCSSALFRIEACQAVILPTGTLKPNLRSLPMPNISAMLPTDFSWLHLVHSSVFL